MSLNIKNPEAHALAEQVARLSGETLTGAVVTALREKLARLEQKKTFDQEIYDKLLAIGAEVRSRLTEPWLSVDHGDLLYDERGLPK